MRDIKFRAWHLKRGWMGVVVGLDIPYKGTENPTASIVSREIGDDGWDADEYPLKDLAIMRYTGLKDKNGVEVYEDDILHLHYTKGPDCFSKVEFIDGAFMLATRSGSGDTHVYLHTALSFLNADVVGNVFENPELVG